MKKYVLFLFIGMILVFPPALFPLADHTTLPLLLTPPHKQRAKKLITIAWYTLESSIGILLTTGGLAIAYDLQNKGRIGAFDSSICPITISLGIPLTLHGLMRLYQELNMSRQLKNCWYLLKKHQAAQQAILQ
jgi:hypothetical protein